MNNVPKTIAVLTASVVIPTGIANATVTAYTPDANTLFLFNFDEAAGGGVAANSGTAGSNAIGFEGTGFVDNVDQAVNTTLLGGTGAAGFGNAAQLSQNTGFGFDLDNSGGFRLSDGSSTSPDDFADHNGVLGSTGSFTLEGLVNLSAINSNQEIISTDAFYTGAQGGNSQRGFQFRVNANGELEFNFIGTATIAAVTATIPTAGDHAFAANEWFHAAATFDGTDLSLYWTRVDNSFTEANLIGSGADTIDFTDPGPLVIGNEGRTVNNANTTAQLSTEGIVGLLDEVRISDVARGADEFIFSVPEPSTGILAAFGLLGLMRRRR